MGDPVAARPTWKGFLKLSLVSIPVKAYTVRKTDSGEIHLNQLHETCHSRIRYQKTCPLHGEVSNDEIISGYQIAKDQYVPVEPEELKAIRRKSDQSIEIDTFIAPDQLDDRYLTDRSYYLVPDGKVAQKPYTLVRQAIEEAGLLAIAEVILSSRDQLVLVRPLGKLLIMTVLQHEAELKEPADFEEEIVEPETNRQELQLTKQLVQGFTKKRWNYADYQDQYQARLSELVASKIEGKQLVTTPEDEAPAVINLMDALKASIDQMPATGSSRGESKKPRGASSSRASSATAAKAKAVKPTKEKPQRIAARSAPRSSSSKGKRARNTG
ncbi:MAG: Ku protein [Planctomycetaceae bacterium]